ncbi:uncharacterized protein [Procambarus clarkii]|uniref:uncharacterized protein isoform X2 n=1 Tax=Procambarus clarkii TaxID=6728 RepID=UPI0037431C1F
MIIAITILLACGGALGRAPRQLGTPVNEVPNSIPVDQGEGSLPVVVNPIPAANPQLSPQVIPQANPIQLGVRPQTLPQVFPSGNAVLEDAQIGHLLRTAPAGSQLLRTTAPVGSLLSRLPDNATLIRTNIVDTFSCSGRVYGYYADQDNDCQIFHVCLPLQQLYPANFTKETTFIFSFICPQYTIFSQDSLTCAWESEALPCEAAATLYGINDSFFKKIRDSDGKERYAQLGENFSPSSAGSGATFNIP